MGSRGRRQRGQYAEGGVVPVWGCRSGGGGDGEVVRRVDGEVPRRAVWRWCDFGQVPAVPTSLVSLARWFWEAFAIPHTKVAGWRGTFRARTAARGILVQTCSEGT